MLRTTPRRPVDAVVLGEAVVDLFPEPPGASLEEAGRFTRHLGGAGANLAVGLARQGVPTALLGLVGKDALGRFLRQRLQEEGVVVDGLGQHKSARTGLVFAAPERGGFLAYRNPSADLLVGPEDDVAAPAARGRVLCLSSVTLIREAAQRATQEAQAAARGRGALVFCDVNLRPHLWSHAGSHAGGDSREAPGRVRRLLAGCDAVKLTREELPLLFGEESVEGGAAQARRLGPRLVVVTLGAEGCYLEVGADSAYLAADPVRLVDRTGAGDAFSAGLLSALLRELPTRAEDGGEALRERFAALPFEVFKRACARGNYLGARACTEVGATSAVPRGG